MSMKKVLLGTLITAAFAAAAPFASAETTDTNTDATVVAQAAQSRTQEARPRMQAPDQRRFRLPSERVEARLAYAKTALKITDAQSAQWESFANVLLKHGRDMDQRFGERRAKWEAARGEAVARGQQAEGQRPQRPQVSAIERLERRQQMMQERSARLNEVIAAAKPLYASFSPEQKQIADGMLARQQHGSGQHHHHQHRGMHRGA
jgi:hypothetical protein